MRVEQFLTDSAQHHGAKIALVAGDQRLTFAEIDVMADRLASSLLAGGVCRGDRVVVFMDNCWQAVVAIFAALKAGAVFCPVNPSTKLDKLSFIVNNCRAAAIITQGRLMPVAQGATAQASGRVLLVVAEADHECQTDSTMSFEVAIDNVAPSSLPDPGIEIDLAMLIYTSGSTGFPKGVMMTHANITAAAESITLYLQNTADDVILGVLPIAFDYGLYQVLMAVKLGARLVLEKSFAFPHAVLAKMRTEAVTGFPMVPTMAALLLQMKDLKPGALPHLRYITNTAAALPPAFIARLAELFPDTAIYSMYGLT
ncbi:MAG: class I adenylate-forming enzyme family protein, partial [Hyphomicrobiales bacterium]